MRVYSDTSCLIKLLVEEEGSAQTHDYLPRAWPAAALVLTPVEINSGLQRMINRADITREQASLAAAQFATIWSDMLQLLLTPAVVQDACSLVFEHDLRTVDSLHLAAALQLATDLEDEVVLATFDQRLAQAALVRGLRVWPAVASP